MFERYLEDFAVGQTFSSGRSRIDEERIKSFAAEFDPQPFHLDAAAAQLTIFGGLAASGWHTAAVTMRLLVKANLSLQAGSLGPASMRSAGRVRCGHAMSCASRAKCSRCGHRSRIRTSG